MIGNPIKAGLLAYGMSGKVFHAPFLETHAGFNLTAIVERSKNEALKDYPNVKIYRSSEALLADEEIELVVVNTPNYTHYELAKAALNAGKHVLIEKPLSVLRAEAEELFSLAFRKGLKVFAYQNRRFDSDFLSVKEVLESGKIGKIVEAHFRFDRYRDEISVKFFKEEPMPGAGILYDLGAHIIDQAISVFGVPDEFDKSYGNNRALSQVDDYAHVHLKYKNGVNIYVTANMLVADAPAAYSIYGTKGTYTKHRTDVQEEQLLAGIKPSDNNYGIENSGSEGKLVYYNDKGDKLEELVSIRKGDYMELFDGVYNSIRNKAEYYVQQNEIMAQLRILEK
jgi:scyllo-inositol 2-dehydrogenase (NADP+)